MARDVDIVPMPLTALRPEEVVLVGFSRTILQSLSGALPDNSVIVIDEPDVIRKRGLRHLADTLAPVAGLVEWEYQRSGAARALARALPALRAARGVLPGVEYAVPTAAGLAEVLGLPGAGTNAAAIFRNKLRQRQLAERVGLPSPRYRVVGNAAAAVDFFDELGGTCVIKPTRRQASVGVQVLTKRDTVPAAFEHARCADEPLLVPDRGIASELIVEEVVRGAEFSVELLVRHGHPCFSNVTGKTVLPGRYPVELGHTAPAEVPETLRTELAALTGTLASAAQFGTGILHCEWIVGAEGPRLVECAARLPGDEIARLISLAYGFSLPQTYLQLLLGETISPPARPQQAAAIRFFTAPPGVVVSIAGADEASRLHGVEQVTVSAAVGDVVADVTSSWGRLGHAIAVGANPEEARRRADAAAEAVSIRTRDRNVGRPPIESADG